MREIIVVDYSNAWPQAFQAEKALIESIIGSLSPKVHHIGSTSVEQLAAKPIIDILIEVDDVGALEQFNQGFEEIGYLVKGEFGIPGRRYFEKGGDERSHHIHAFNRGCDHVVRHLAFRDYMRKHPEAAQAYADVKRKVASECDGIEQYCMGKNDFVQHHEKKALAWWALSNGEVALT